VKTGKTTTLQSRGVPTKTRKNSAGKSADPRAKGGVPKGGHIRKRGIVTPPDPSWPYSMRRGPEWFSERKRGKVKAPRMGGIAEGERNENEPKKGRTTRADGPDYGIPELEKDFTNLAGREFFPARNHLEEGRGGKKEKDKCGAENQRKGYISTSQSPLTRVRDRKKGKRKPRSPAISVPSGT